MNLLNLLNLINQTFTILYLLLQLVLGWHYCNSGCFGPFTCDVLIPYNNPTLNQGNGYNPAQHQFSHTTLLQQLHLVSILLWSFLPSKTETFGNATDPVLV